MDPKKDFTAGEVMILVEELKSQFRTVTEIVTTLHEDMISVKDRLERVENRLTILEDAVKIAIPSLTSDIKKLKEKVGV